uniref:Chromosome 2 open reading frame 15 n=1 Tax=Monodon monoceros TaxID=40151 RepID=A0A8C6BYM4_MONMO
MSSIPEKLSSQVEETSPLLKEGPANYFYSAVPMGFSLSKSATQVSAMRMDSKVDDHLMQGTEKSKLEPVTQLFQNTKKIRLEDTNQENFTRSKDTGTGSLSEKALGSVVYVKESDGIEMIDVE